jgi:hypothetical protein
MVQRVSVVLVSVVFAVDLSAIPQPRTTRTRVAPIYKQLGHQPPGIVVEYPLAPQPLAETLEALRPDMPSHPSFTGYDPGSPSESRKQELSYLDAPRTVPDLASYGVRYVIAGRGAVPSRTPSGLQRITETHGSVLYRVTARLPRFVSYANPGFNLTEAKSPGLRWMAHNGAQLDLWGACSPCDGFLSFGSGTFVEPRTLTVSDPSGNVLFNELIRSAAQPVAFHIRFSNTTWLTFRTNPPPIHVPGVLKTLDPQTFAIYVAQPVRFTPDAANHWTGAGVRMTAASLNSDR